MVLLLVVLLGPEVGLEKLVGPGTIFIELTGFARDRTEFTGLVYKGVILPDVVRLEVDIPINNLEEQIGLGTVLVELMESKGDFLEPGTGLKNGT